VRLHSHDGRSREFILAFSTPKTCNPDNPKSRYKPKYFDLTIALAKDSRAGKQVAIPMGIEIESQCYVCDCSTVYTGKSISCYSYQPSNQATINITMVTIAKK
jgi:hypothetical protein